MSDAERVAAIERRHELDILNQLLREKSRPVPPPPVAMPELRQLMRLIAETFYQEAEAA